MNKGILTIGIILLSVVALLFVNILSNYSTGSELDYYLVKETVDAAMVDAIDYSYYKSAGLHRIDKEKFVESFLYRFADAVDKTRTYDVYVYDINEVPPKVSIKIDSVTVLSAKNRDTGEREGASISTNYDAILETDYNVNPLVEEGLVNGNNGIATPIE
ncbi:MAG: hypothetical protein IJ842_02665 [Bacilli bacterium]|nr:hypothetical protein [Bacilli bacterium]